MCMWLENILKSVEYILNVYDDVTYVYDDVTYVYVIREHPEICVA